jgi:hypothetical protein
MKTLSEVIQALDEVRGGGINVQYSIDSKLVPDNKGGYRTVRARRIKVGDKAPNPFEIDAPGVGDSINQDKDMGKSIYDKYYKKYLQSLRKTNNPTVKEEITLDEQKFESEPPFILVLKRKNVRLFPNNVKVALYHSEKLNKFFSVPYGQGLNSVVQAEEVQHIDEEHNIVFSMLKAFASLNEDNQQKMLEKINDGISYDIIKKFVLGRDEFN